MAVIDRAPRLWIDVEHGATYGKPASSVDTFDALRGVLGPLTEAWLFHRVGAPLLRGFFYPLSTHERFGVPKGRGPGLVLIDDVGDQLWLSGASCGPGEGGAAAMEVLAELDFDLPDRDPERDAAFLAGDDEMHFVDGHLAGHRPLGEPTPQAPPGRTFVRGRRLVNRWEFDRGGVTAADLRQLWAMATQPTAWLGLPTALILYGNTQRSEESGHDGCQLIASGESGRELWLRLPEPDEYNRVAPGRMRSHFEGSVTEFEAVKQSIFRAVGVDICPPDDRPLRDKLIGRHRAPPEMIRWP